MRNLAILAFAAVMFTACGNPGHVTVNETTCDTCVVDSTEVVDTLATESVVMDSVSTDTISE